MIRVLINGADSIACQYISNLHQQRNVKIVAIICDDLEAPGILLAKKLHLHVSNTFDDSLLTEVDYIIFPTKNGKLLKRLRQDQEMITIMAETDKVIFNDIIYHQNLDVILNTIDDGLIVINDKEEIRFINHKASLLIGISKSEAINRHVNDIISNSGLAKVLQTRKKEINKQIILKNGKKVITSRIPIINEDNHLLGAFAFFKNNDDVIKLAEENTNLNEIKSTLTAVVNASDEAISVVDENGIGLIINPAYTKLTGWSESELIGKPASIDVTQGESMHLQVLKTRRAVRAVSMHVGPNNKEVSVNVEPIIVNGKLKGSVAVIHDVSALQYLEKNLSISKQIIRNLETTYTFADVIYQSEGMSLVINQAKTAADSPVTVLLKGQFGTGKELLAHAIHNEGPRKYNKFIRVNCSSYSEEELGKELFGVEELLPTGKVTIKQIGLFEVANSGTIFLDEISALSDVLQKKILYFLQNQHIIRIAGKEKVPLNVRVITATSINLEKAIMDKTFREDLYYSLNRLSISIPSLVDRISDIPLLVEHLIVNVNQKYGRNVKGISDAALRQLTKYNWPGNVRELQNVISRSIIFMSLSENIIQTSHLPNIHHVEKEDKRNLTEQSLPLQDVMDDYEKTYIKKIYKRYDFNKTKTAKVLNISVRNLYYKVDKYGLDDN